MIASAIRFSTTLARQPAKSAVSSSATAGLKTSASSRAVTATSSLVVNEDGRLCSRNRRQHVADPTAPLPRVESEVKWDNIAARNKDAKALVGL